jgi:hypothetical protein
MCHMADGVTHLTSYAGSPRLAGTPTNARTEPSTTSLLTQQPLYKTAVVVSAEFYVRS